MKERKLLFTADWHITNTSLLDRKIGEKYFKAKTEILYALVQYAIEEEVKDFVIVGDIFNNPEPPSILRRTFNEIVSALLVAEIKVWIVGGNHEYQCLGDNVLSEMKTLPLMKRMHIIEGNDVAYRNNNIHSGGIYFHPWSREGFEPISRNNYEFFFGHMATKGSMMADGYKCKTGESKLRKKIVAKHYILGHFHIPSSKKNVHYCGSPYPITFNEVNTDKRVLIYDGKLKSVLIKDILARDEYTPSLKFRDFTLVDELSIEKLKVIALKTHQREMDMHGTILRIKYDYRVVPEDDIKLIKTLFDSKVCKPFYIEWLPVKCDDMDSQTVIDEVNENNVMSGLAEYVNEFWGKKSLRKKAVKILQRAEDDLNRLS